MGRYLLFAGEDYYAAGGWNDYIGSFSSVKAALQAVEDTRRVVVSPEWSYQADAKQQHGLHSSTSSNLLAPTEPEPPFVPVLGRSFGGGTITAVDGDKFTITIPESTSIHYDYDWAHVVHRGKVVAEWHV